MKKRRKRVLVAMSGGVDSSVAASLLVDQGYDVIGMIMQVWDYSQCNLDEGHGTCCSSVDVDDARTVASCLDIPFYVLNCEAFFKETVIDPFVNSYLKGETPIPCVNCNTYLKFDHLFEKMKELECDHLATGHYAQIKKEKGQHKLVTSSDDWKDQTYFLFTLPKENLKHLIFPVGHMNKKEVRDYAQKKNLPLFNKKDSTGICFIGKKGYAHFIESQVSSQKLKPGLLKSMDKGEVLGEHKGIHHFTYGQRKGLGIAGQSEALFVVKVDKKDHTVWLGKEHHLYSEKCNVLKPHLLDEIKSGETLDVKVRFSQKSAKAKVFFTNKDEFEVSFLEPQRSVTPGQACVFYRGSQLLGGGWIHL